MYKQCVLKKKVGDTEKVLVTHIEEKYAKQGKIVKVKINDSWDENWTVWSCGSLVDEPENPNTVIKNHKRKTGDIR